MLQSIDSVRGIAQRIANQYWPEVCSVLYPECIALDGDLESGEILIGEKVFTNDLHLFWTVSSKGENLRTVMLNLEHDGKGISSVAELVVSSPTEIDVTRSDPTNTNMQHPTIINMVDVVKFLDTIMEIIKSPSGLVSQSSTYKLSEAIITKG